MSDYFGNKNVGELMGIKNYLVKTKNSGDIRVHVQGNISKSKCTFITVHDLGTNHQSMVAFVNSLEMRKLKKEACFLHVVVPGHEDNASDLLAGNFPSLKTLGQDLIYVLDYFRAPPAIGIGDGAGAIVLLHLGFLYAFRIPTLLLVNCAAIVNNKSYLFQGRYTGWKRGKMLEVESYFLSHHKYSMTEFESYESIYRFVTAFRNYIDKLKKGMNHNNVKLYVKAFLSRENVILENCRAELLLMAGRLSPYAPIEDIDGEENQNTCYPDMVDEVSDIISEAPGAVAQKILNHCRNNGLLMTARDAGSLKRKANMGPPSTIIAKF